MSKIGRNETCPCGSGYKYKRCCLPATVVPTPPTRVERKAPRKRNIALTAALYAGIAAGVMATRDNNEK
jgi:uncharacterized protein YchJ